MDAERAGQRIDRLAAQALADQRGDPVVAEPMLELSCRRRRSVRLVAAEQGREQFGGCQERVAGVRKPSLKAHSSLSESQRSSSSVALLRVVARHEHGTNLSLSNPVRVLEHVGTRSAHNIAAIAQWPGATSAVRHCAELTQHGQVIPDELLLGQLPVGRRVDVDVLRRERAPVPDAQLGVWANCRLRGLITITNPSPWPSLRHGR